MSETVNRTVYAVLLLVLVIGAVSSGRVFLADMKENSVALALDTWQENGAVPSLEGWQQTFGRISTLTYGENLAGQIEEPDFRSTLLVDGPDDIRVGNYYRLLALTYEWRLFVSDAPVEISTELEYRNLALQAWSAAVKVRPAWPESWSQLARNKAYLGEFDDTFYTALTQAIRLGQKEQATQLQIIQTASMSWPYLNRSFEGADVKARVLATIQSALSSSHNLPQHLSFLSDSGLLEEVCLQIDTSVLVTRAREACTSLTGPV